MLQRLNLLLLLFKNVMKRCAMDISSRARSAGFVEWHMWKIDERCFLGRRFRGGLRRGCRRLDLWLW